MANLVIQSFLGMYPARPIDSLALGTPEYCLDVNLKRNSLIPFRTDSVIGAAPSGAKSIYDLNACCILTSPHECTTWGELNPSPTCDERIAKTEPGTTPKVATHRGACNNQWRDLSFPCFPAPSVFTPDPGWSSRTEQGYIVYTVVDDWGRESAPSAISSLIKFEFGSNILISGLPSTYPNGSAIKVYLSRASWSSGNETGLIEEASGFFLLGSVGMVASVTLTVDYPGEANTTEDYHSAPDNLWSISSFRGGQLFGISDNQLRFCINNTFHAWPRKNAIVFYGKAVKCVLGKSIGYVLTDEAPLTFRIPAGCSTTDCLQATQLANEAPCLSHRSVAMFNDTVIYASRKGLVAVTGTDVKYFPQWDERTWQEMQPEQISGVVFDGAYFGVSPKGAFRLELGTEGTRALTMVSEVTQVLSSTSRDRLVYVDSNSKFRSWNTGDSFKTAIWKRSKGFRSGVQSAYSSISVVASGKTVVDIYCDGVVTNTVTLYGDSWQRMTPTRGRLWGSQITSQNEVQAVIIGGSPNNLP